MRQHGEFWIDVDQARRDESGNPTITLRAMTIWGNPLGVEVARLNPSVYYRHPQLAEFIAKAATDAAQGNGTVDAAFRRILAGQ